MVRTCSSDVIKRNNSVFFFLSINPKRDENVTKVQGLLGVKANEKGFRRKRFLEGTGNPIVNRKERIKLYTKELGKSVNRTTGKTNLKKKKTVNK